MKYRLIACLLLILLPALACTITSNSSAPLPTVANPAGLAPTATSRPAIELFTRYSDPELGLTFEHPAGWPVQSVAGLVTLASDPALLRPDALYSPGGAVILIISTPATSPAGNDPASDLAAAVAHLDVAAAAEIVDGPTVRTAGDREIITALVEGQDRRTGQDVSFHVTFIRGSEQDVIVAGTTLQADSDYYRPLFERIAASVELLGLTVLPGPAEPETVGALQLNQTVTGTIPQDGAVAWTLTAEEGTIIDVVAEPAGDGLDLALDVLRADGRSLLPGGLIDDSFGTESLHGLRLPATATYRVVLRGFLGSSGAYALTVSEATTGPPELVPGRIVSGTLDGGNPAVYSLPASAGVSVTLLVAPADTLDVVLELLDEDNTLLLSADEGFAGEGELALFVPPADGNYRVRLRDFAAGDGGTFTLSAVTEGSARLAADGQVAQGESVDYALTLPAGEIMVVAALPGEGFDLVVSLLGPDNALLRTVDLGFANAPELFAFTAPNDGLYTVRVGGFEGAAGNFRVIVSGNEAAGTAPATPGRPTTIAPGEVFTTTLAGGAEDSYDFSATPGSEVLFFLLPNESLDLVATVTQADGTALLQVDGGFAGEAEVVRFRPPQTGNYTLQVQGFARNSGTYMLGMLDRSAALLNDSGTIPADGAVGYNLVLEANDSRLILVFPEEGFDAIVAIWDASGETIAESDIGIAGEVEMLLFRPERGGQYTVRIRGFVGAGGGYQVIIVPLP